MQHSLTLHSSSAPSTNTPSRAPLLFPLKNQQHCHENHEQGVSDTSYVPVFISSNFTTANKVHISKSFCFAVIPKSVYTNMKSKFKWPHVDALIRMLFHFDAIPGVSVLTLNYTSVIASGKHLSCSARRWAWNAVWSAGEPDNTLTTSCFEVLKNHFDSVPFRMDMDFKEGIELL